MSKRYLYVSVEVFLPLLSASLTPSLPLRFAVEQFDCCGGFGIEDYNTVNVVFNSTTNTSDIPVSCCRDRNAPTCTGVIATSGSPLNATYYSDVSVLTLDSLYKNFRYKTHSSEKCLLIINMIMPIIIKSL